MSQMRRFRHQNREPIGCILLESLASKFNQKGDPGVDTQLNGWIIPWLGLGIPKGGAGTCWGKCYFGSITACCKCDPFNAERKRKAALNGPIINVKKAGELIFLPLISPTAKKLTTLGEISKKKVTANNHSSGFRDKTPESDSRNRAAQTLKELLYES